MLIPRYERKPHSRRGGPGVADPPYLNGSTAFTLRAATLNLELRDGASFLWWVYTPVGIVGEGH